MGDHDTVLAKLHKLWQYDIHCWRCDNHVIPYRGEFLNPERNRYLRVYKCGIAVYNLATDDLHRTYFYDFILFRRKACCLYIKYHVLVIQRLTGCILHNILCIIDQICFHTVNDLEFIIHSMVSIRECLHITVVCNSNGLVPPAHGTLHNILYVRHAIHVTHLGVTVKLNTFFGSCILPL